MNIMQWNAFTQLTSYQLKGEIKKTSKGKKTFYYLFSYLASLLIILAKRRKNDEKNDNHNNKHLMMIMMIVIEDSQLIIPQVKCYLSNVFFFSFRWNKKKSLLVINELSDNQKSIKP